jgi:shikimate dehydrogenase
LYGYNTDGPGLLLALQEELDFTADGKSVLILGAGGAARGAAFALARSHARALYISNRSVERAEGLAANLSEHFPGTDIEPLGSPGEIHGEQVDLVINATSLGLKKGDPSPLDLGGLAGKPAVYDMVYGRETALLADAAKRGLRSAGGLGMLVNQAAIAFKHWTGTIEGVREVMSRAAREAAQARTQAA